MCQGFGVIVKRDLSVYWTAGPDSFYDDQAHSDILNKLGMPENTDPFDREFVRVQFAHWKPEDFEFDENATLPAWAENNADAIMNTCVDVLEKLQPVHDAFVRAIDRAGNNRDIANHQLKLAKSHLREFAASSLFRHEYDGEAIEYNPMDAIISRGMYAAQDENNEVYQSAVFAAWDVATWDLPRIKGYVK